MCINVILILMCNIIINGNIIIIIIMCNIILLLIISNVY